MLHLNTNPQYAEGYKHGYKEGYDAARNQLKNDIIGYLNIITAFDKKETNRAIDTFSYNDGAEVYDGWGDWPGKG